MHLRTILTTAVVALVATAPATAQDTREEQLAAIQADKAAHLRPYEPTRLERRLERAERLDSSVFATGPAYLFVGTAFDGSGLAAGPGYRRSFRDTGSFDTHAAWSLKNYKAVDATVALPKMARERVSVELQGNWLDAPDVAFYGVGNSSLQSNHTGFAYETKTAGVSARLQATRLFAVGGGLDAMQIDSDSVDPTYRKSRVFAEIDSRTSPGYTKSGGLYRLEWSNYQQMNAGSSSFHRLDAEVQQFIPVVRENWVIALRALASTTDTAAGQDVPFFLMPDLGGSHTLRGYPAWRFRDRNRMLFTGEYRWTAGPLVDMALFFDAGKVAARAKDLDLGGLKKTYGLGMSVHTPVSTVTRIEIARTAEGTSLVFSFSPSF